VEPEKLFKIFGEFKIPEDQKRAFERDRAGCVIGRDLVKTFGFKLGDRINLTGDIYPGTLELTVRGIFDSPSANPLLYFNKEYLDQSMPERRRGVVSMFEILIDNPANAARIGQAVDANFHNSPSETKTESEQAFFVGFLALLGNVKMFLLAIASAVTFTVLLVSANTMAMSVRERVREVGVLKTLGFTPAAVLGLILGEALVISVAGGGLGWAISVMLMRGVAKSPFGSFLPPMPFIEPGVAGICLAAAGVIGLISSIAPAIGASRTSIVVALRSSD
jgi:putative ABC transport system permease protein